MNLVFSNQLIWSTCLILMLVGCQSTATHSDLEKRQQIETMYADYAHKFPEVKSISVQELKQLQQQQEVILVDVRSPEERAVSIIPGSIDQAEFESNLEQYRQSLVVAYCTIGYRSGRYAQKMLQQGVTIINLKGSLLAWSHEGEELLNKAGKTNKVHVFGRKWNLVADNYQPVW